jgi:hypothetical protein
MKNLPHNGCRLVSEGQILRIVISGAREGCPHALPTRRILPITLPWVVSELGMSRGCSYLDVAFPALPA